MKNYPLTVMQSAWRRLKKPAPEFLEPCVARAIPISSDPYAAIQFILWSHSKGQTKLSVAAEYIAHRTLEKRPIS